MSISLPIESRNRRIATNSILLFARMILVLLINLFTLRWILKGLGFQDYGIYTAVSGMVTACTCISNVLILGAQRFYSYALGEHNYVRVKEIFNVSLRLIIVISISILVVYEILGPWFITNQLSLPARRMGAALIVMHISLLTFIFSLIQIPYQAAIFSHEDMGIYAIVSFVDSLAKLVLARIISMSSIDHLAFYSMALMVENCLVMILYIYLGTSKYRECRIDLHSRVNTGFYKELLSFTGWSFYGSIAGIGMTQGSILLLNIYFGPTINGTFGISLQVYSAIVTLSNTVVFAFRPALTKAYSSKDKHYMVHLFYLFNKTLFLLTVCVAIPLLIWTKPILTLWLGQISENLVLFTRLHIIYTMCLIMHNPITVCLQAMGKMKRYSLSVESLTILSVPLTWFSFKCGAPCHYIFYIMIALCGAAHIIRIHILHHYIPELTYGRYVINIFKIKL